jgi:hypothetical protein
LQFGTQCEEGGSKINADFLMAYLELYLSNGLSRSHENQVTLLSFANHVNFFPVSFDHQIENSEFQELKRQRPKTCSTVI